MASEAEEAASLLSRFPQGRVPSSLPILDALGILAESGGDEHVSLLESLVEDESEEIAQAASEAMRFIDSRERHTLRTNFQAPSRGEVDLLAKHFVDADIGFGLYERRMLAYAVLVLGELPENKAEAWQEQGAAHEKAGDSRRALQVYSQAAALGDAEAFDTLHSYGIDGEKLILGIWTAWCPDQSDTSNTLQTLVDVGSIHTVRVLANRAARSRAYHRALALDGLSRMLTEGKLTRSATAEARSGLILGTRDPHTDVRRLARTALSELHDQSNR